MENAHAATALRAKLAGRVSSDAGAIPPLPTIALFGNARAVGRC